MRFPVAGRQLSQKSRLEAADYDRTARQVNGHMHACAGKPSTTRRSGSPAACASMVWRRSIVLVAWRVLVWLEVRSAAIIRGSKAQANFSRDERKRFRALARVPEPEREAVKGTWAET